MLFNSENGFHYKISPYLHLFFFSFLEAFIANEISVYSGQIAALISFSDGKCISFWHHLLLLCFLS